MDAFLKFIGYSKELEEKLRITYIIAFFGVAQVAIFLVFFLVAAPNIWLILETLVVFIGYLAVIPLLKYKQYTISKVIYIFGITFQVIMLVFVWFTRETYLVLYFYIIPPIAFFILDFGVAFEKRFLMFVSVVVSIAVVCYSFIEPRELIVLSRQIVDILKIMSVVSTMVSEIIVFYFFGISLHKTNKELMLLANTDSLTNVSNRRRLFETGEELFKIYQKHHQSFCLMILDIDHFKKINDTYGHPVGDDVLRELSDLIEKSIRKEDLLCRYGGEEFAILFKNLEGNHKESIESIKERISNHTFVIEERAEIELTISAGVVSSTDDVKDFDDLVKKADALLYIAKQSGRNRIEYFDKKVPEVQRCCEEN